MGAIRNNAQSDTRSAPRVTLIRPLHAEDESEFQEPLSVECLAGYLRAQGVEAAVLDRRLYAMQGRSARFWNAFARLQETGEATVVGFSVTTEEDVPDALQIMERIRARWPKTCFVAGGLFVTTAFEQAHLRFPASTVLIRGEGEAPLLALARGERGEAESARALEPNQWAPAARDDLGAYLDVGCSINLRTSRGCAGSCVFCATPSLPKPYRTWAPRAIDVVVDEIEALAARAHSQNHPPVFNVVDDDFGPLARVEDLDRELRVRGLDIAYSLQMRGLSLCREEDLLDRLGRLREGGFTRLFIGLESVDPDTLRRWNKPFDVEAMLAALGTFKRAGIQTHIGYILWHRASTIAGAKRQARVLREHGLFTTKCSLSRMILFPGSRLGDAEMGRRESTRWESLAPECERMFMAYGAYIEPLYQVWVRAATRAPHLAALAHLTGDHSACAQVDALIERCDEYAYRAFIGEDYSGDAAGFAAALGEELDAICSPR